MGRSSYGGGGGDRRPRRDYRQSYNRRKVCQFCVDKTSYIDYKDVNRLRRFLSDRARIEPRRSTGTCAKHQRRLSTAIKRARTLALLPYTPEQLKTLGFTRQEGFRGRSEYRPRYQRSEGGGYRGGGRYQSAPPERQASESGRVGPPEAEAAAAPAAEAAPEVTATGAEQPKG